MEKIIAVAIRTDRETFALPPPCRHSDVFLDIQAVGERENCMQGFLTNQCNFYNRKEAKKIAEKAGQIINLTELDELYSEDLW